jgi:hypothetical protein
MYTKSIICGDSSLPERARQASQSRSRRLRLQGQPSTSLKKRLEDQKAREVRNAIGIVLIVAVFIDTNESSGTTLNIFPMNVMMLTVECINVDTLSCGRKRFG